MLFRALFRLRGVLDPGQAVPGLGASVSEALALDLLAGDEAAATPPGGLTQQVLGAALGLEKSTVSRLVDAMTRKGWVERHRDQANRRYQVLRLTEGGERAAREIADAMSARHARIMAALTDAEHHAVHVGVSALVRAFANEIDNDSSRAEP